MKTAITTKAPTNVLLRNPVQTGNEAGRRVKHSEVLSLKEEEAVIKFYDELAPEAKNMLVDVDMIINKAYPVFEKELGAANWRKIQRYFGIDGKNISKSVRYDEVSILISKLRTIENAQYYLYGFSELIEQYAAKLSRTPEGMTAIEKAKVVRMYVMLFGGYLFFAEDYVWFFGSKEGEISFPKAMQVNVLNIFPEEMFYLFSALVKKYSDGSFLYDAIVGEIKALDKKLRKEILDFSELRFNPTKDVLFSVNEKHMTKYTFGHVREIKTKMFPCCGYFPNELYVVTDLWKGLEFGELYKVYKKLTENEFSSFFSAFREMPHVEGKNFSRKKMEFKSIAPNVEMSSEDEAKRYMRFIEYLARNNFSMPIDLTNEEKNEIYTEQVEIGKFFAFLRFAHAVKYLDQKSDASEEYSMYLTLLELDHESKYFEAYMRNEISEEELKSGLGITKEFEEKTLGIKHIEKPMETVRRFAIEQGVCEDELSEELVENVLISGNERVWARFSTGDITANKLMEKLGFDRDIMEMYFNLSKVDIPVIEQKLQELKSRRVSAKEMRQNALTIHLYCYIIEGQIACGPKNKTPKGNKRLKPENLKKLLAVA